MPKFSKRSEEQLSTAHPDLVKVFEEVIKKVDCTILDGHRGKARQEELLERGLSKLKYPNSKHNVYPSLAVDAAPYPIDWNDRERATYFAGYVQGVANQLGVRIRWGGDWNGDWQVRDNSFDDLWHFELRTEEKDVPG